MVARNQKPDLDSMLLKLDYYLKQEEDLFAVSALSDLISATSSDFYFKDVSDRTISMFTEGGVAIGPLSYLLKAEDDLGRTYRADDADAFTGLKDSRFLGLNRTLRSGDVDPEWEKFFAEGTEQTWNFLDSLMPEGTENDNDAQEAGEALTEALVTDGEYLDYNSSDIFPKEGIMLEHPDAGAIRIVRADPKDSSKGYNILRNDKGGSYSKVAPWGDDQTQLNDKPIRHYKNAYKTAKDSMVATSGDKGIKPKLRLGQGSQRVTRQQRRNLIQKVEKKLASREKAIKKSVAQQTRERWKNNAKEFVASIPERAKDAAGKSIKELGQKALEAADAFIEQGKQAGEDAKPGLRAAAQKIADAARSEFYNAQDAWDSAKQFAQEKAPILRAVLHQAKVKGTPAWNAAVKKGVQLSYSAMNAAGKGWAKTEAAREATSGFLGRMKAEFRQGYQAEIESRLGKQPSGDTYKNNPQQYWEGRSKLATEYAQATSAYEKATAKADRIEDPKESNKAKVAAWGEFQTSRDAVAKGAEEIGSSLGAVENHVKEIRQGNKAVLPPAAGFPTEYGGKTAINRLRKNIKAAGLKPFPNEILGGGVDAPKEPELRDVPVAEPEAAEPEAAIAGDSGEQLPLMPEYGQGALPGMGVEGQPLESDAPGVQPPQPQPQPERQIEMPMPDAEGGQENKAAAAIPSNDREYVKPGFRNTRGLTMHTGVDRAGKKSTFYSKKESASKSQQGDVNTAGPTPHPINVPRKDVGFQGKLEMAGEDEMADPINDYKEEADAIVEESKQSQAKSKMRTAKANARVAKARANEAEAKAKRSEADSGVHIADILAKLDDRIAVLNAHKNPKISSVLSKLEDTIDSIDKIPASKK